MSPKAPKPKICTERAVLSKNLLEALSGIAALQTQQTANIISGGEGLPRIEVAVEAARRRWEEARDAYTSHITEHGC